MIVLTTLQGFPFPNMGIPSNKKWLQKIFSSCFWEAEDPNLDPQKSSLDWFCWENLNTGNPSQLWPEIPVITSYNPIYRMYNPTEITSYN